MLGLYHILSVLSGAFVIGSGVRWMRRNEIMRSGKHGGDMFGKVGVSNYSKNVLYNLFLVNVYSGLIIMVLRRARFLVREK